MELYILEDYKEIYPELKNSDLTDQLIKDCLEEYGIAGAQVCRTEKGKPYAELCSKPEIPGGECKVHLSVSHSEDVFVCIIGERPVGIDLQHHRKVSAQKIAARYFTDSEKEYMETHGKDGFFKLWTRKEAYSKLTGKGLEEIMSGTGVLDREDVEFIDIQLEEGLWCSYCTEK